MKADSTTAASKIRPAHALPLVLTMGDPAGIGPEITLAAYARRQQAKLPPFYVRADADLLQARARALGQPVTVESLTIPKTVQDIPIDEWTSQVSDVYRRALPVLHHVLSEDSRPGHPDQGNATNTLQSISQAVVDVRHERAAAVVTNPIAKDVLYAAGFTHPGHTEYLGELAQKHWGHAGRSVMMLVAEEMRVVPTTIHIPLQDVSANLTPDLLRETLRIVLWALQRDFGISSPRVACTGLNPHAGENATIGQEDRDVIAPVIQAFATEGHAISGPFPADTLFHAAARAQFDAIVAMYHDQALIPIKTLAFDRGVNVTLGLPFVRTSPDHGTAFNIAGTGTANPTSLIEAIKTAGAMAETRSTTVSV